MNMTDLGSIGEILLSKRILFYVLCAFLVLVVIASLVLFYHWTKYAKETDMKYKLMQLIYIVGIVFILLVTFFFYFLI